jgi:hypothetical protein
MSRLGLFLGECPVLQRKDLQDFIVFAPFAFEFIGMQSSAFRRIRTLAQSLSSSLDLTAAAMAAIRCSRGLAQVLLRTKVEFLLALGAAEVICLPFELGLSSGVSCFYVHAANRIFHSCRGMHDYLPCVPHRA